ncbi:unnamed protein product, partial [marine sediment metagenome]
LVNIVNSSLFIDKNNKQYEELIGKQQKKRG